jgi:hypothetical protein
MTSQDVLWFKTREEVGSDGTISGQVSVAAVAISKASHLSNMTLSACRQNEHIRRCPRDRQ